MQFGSLGDFSFGLYLRAGVDAGIAIQYPWPARALAHYLLFRHCMQTTYLFTSRLNVRVLHKGFFSTQLNVLFNHSILKLLSLLTF
jgi:hypothetical protein